MKRLVHQPQECSGACQFLRQGGRLVATPGAIETFGEEVIAVCLCRLQHAARSQGGLDYLQVFLDEESSPESSLWFIEDEPGLVTALLPEEY